MENSERNRDNKEEYKRLLLFEAEEVNFEEHFSPTEIATRFFKILASCHLTANF